jgi:hypothetical protein
MASFMDDFKEQEGGTDATESSDTSGAIDSDNVSLIGTRDRDAISRARLRARGPKPKDELDITPILQGTRDTGVEPVVPISEQLGSMFNRFGQSIAAGTGDVAMGAATSREMVDNPDYMIDNNLDFAHMSPTEQAEVVRKMEGKSPEEQRKIRLDEYTAKRDEFILRAKNFAEWMPEVEAKKTSGVLGVLDDAMTGMSRFAPTMVVGAVTGGAMSMPMAYMQILPGKMDEYEKAGRSREDAFKYAQGASIALAAVEAMGTNVQLSKMGKLFKGKKGVGQGEPRCNTGGDWQEGCLCMERPCLPERETI